MKKMLGVDIGGVIIDRANDHSDTSLFSENYLKTTPVPGVFEALRELREKQFGNEIYLISKCGPTTERKTREWLRHNLLFEKTGIWEEHLIFCRTRRDKAPICKRLGITHFIDDRISVLRHLETVSKKLLFNPDRREVKKYAHFLPEVLVVNSWQELLVQEL